MVRVVEPATEEVIAELPQAGVEETDAAIARAKEAFPAWRRVAPGDRAALMRAVAAAVRDHGDELARLETRNVGKPISDARGEVGMVADVFDYYAGAPERLLGDTIPVAGGVDFTFREPLGVVGLITPWNFPIAIASWKLGPALAAGNTVVLKPAELTPLTAVELERIAVEAGVPEGVVNVVVGSGRVVGERIVEHPDVAKVAFTGSTEVGRRIAARAAETVKRVTLELGGKSANVIFADAYVDADAPVAIRGNAPEGPGYWFPPTVLCPVSNDERAAREEIFGPVACVIPFRDEQEAVRLANDTIYGLSGSIWTRDGAKALRVARALDTGVLSINSNTSVRVSTPFGGFKQSGTGRELGPHALEHYTELKNVYYAT